jgi:hypothetical protein
MFPYYLRFDSVKILLAARCQSSVLHPDSLHDMLWLPYLPSTSTAQAKTINVLTRFFLFTEMRQLPSSVYEKSTTRRMNYYSVCVDCIQTKFNSELELSHQTQKNTNLTTRIATSRMNDTVFFNRLQRWSVGGAKILLYGSE